MKDVVRIISRDIIMKLDQSSYIESLVKQYNIENIKLYFTPMEQNLDLEPAQSASDDVI